MARFARGNHAYGISDRSGFRYRLKDMKKEWNGLLVGKDEFERKHPQLIPRRVIPDAEALKEAAIKNAEEGINNDSLKVVDTFSIAGANATVM